MPGARETETGVSQRKPSIVGHHKELRKAKDGVDPESYRERGPWFQPPSL